METRGKIRYTTNKALLLRLKVDGPTWQLAWYEFEERYAPIIRGFARNVAVARNVCLNEQDIEDMVGDVMAGFFSAEPRFNYDPAKGRFRGYLKTCVCHAVDKVWRRQRLSSDQSLEEIDPDELQVETVWNDCWESEKLHRAIAIVKDEYLTHPPQPERSRTFRAFEQVVTLERPAAAVAQDLGIPVESVWKAKERVRDAIKEAFMRLDETTG